MKTIFLGTPESAVPFLRALAGAFPPALVVTRPDAKAGRGQQLLPSPVKAAAVSLGLPVATPADDVELYNAVSSVGADAAFVVAYGRLLRKDTLASVPRGFVNIHFSLLPKYRGAAPAQWALINGESKTGVSAFVIEQGLDTGPLLGSRELLIDKGDDAVSLMDKLVPLGVELMLETARAVADGSARPVPQAGQPSLAPKLDKSLARLDFSRQAAELANLIRGLQLGPLPYVLFPANGKMVRVQILKASCVPSSWDGVRTLVPGRISAIERPFGFVVECNHSLLRVEVVRPEGKKPMSASDFANGVGLVPGAMFSSVGVS